MPKHGFLTPKAIGNRIKAKGLQKLRWYCEMCQKQCRDENGFKCHQTSEGHLRQMRIFADNPEAVMEEYSRVFEEEFLEVLSRRHGTKRIRASLVYNEFIAHKTHTHMNSTHFETLTAFVLYLGKTGKCVVDETEKGWYIKWIDRDPRLVAMQEAAAKREKADLDDEEMQAKVIEQQVRAAQAREAERGSKEALGPTELKREEGDGTVSMKLGLGGGSVTSLKRPRPPVATADVFGGMEEGGRLDSGGKGKGKGKGKRSTLEVLMDEDRKRKEAKAQAEASAASVAVAAGGGSGPREGGGDRFDYWLRPGIVVKVLNKKVGEGRYYKRKAVVRKVVERYVAEVKIIDEGDRLRVDQDDLETVIPAVGGEVLVVNGMGRGCRGKLLSLDTDNFSASVLLMDGVEEGKTLKRVEYEDICKAVPAVS
ncbi:unnamed protein product [Choristocarpus tenellus]